MDNNSSEKNVPVSKNYQENVDYLNRELGVPDNFDIVLREMSIGGKRVAIYSINGMVDSHVASYILDALIDLERSDLIVNTLDKLVKERIVALQVSEVETEWMRCSILFYQDLWQFLLMDKLRRFDSSRRACCSNNMLLS